MVELRSFSLDSRADASTRQPGLHPWRRAALAAALQGAREDLGHVGPASLVGRAMRRLPALWMDDQVGCLVRLPIYRAHLAAVGQGDPLFFLAHRHYLARDFSRLERAQAASCHYLTEAQTVEAKALDQIYLGEGLVIWQRDHNGTRYEIRLTHGLDVAQEGGASLTLWADGVRVCVVSFSYVPRRLVDETVKTTSLTALITRKQLTRDRGYQKAFFEAFDRSAPAHLVLAALEGIVQARGGERLYGIRAPAHPIYTAEIAPHLAAAYCEFWESLDGTVASSRAYALEVPMRLRPVEDMKPDRRERALARRGHAEDIRSTARQVMESRLVTALSDL